MNNSTPFQEITSAIVLMFRELLGAIDNVVLFGDVSLLDLWIAITVFGIVFAVMFPVVKSLLSGAISRSDAIVKSKAIDTFNKKKDQHDWGGDW